MTYKVLALDGGGIRGLLTAVVLEEIEAHIGPISAHFDLIAGTSTGGILALGLSKPAAGGGPQFPAKAMRDLYLNEGSTIFPRSVFEEVRTLHGLLDARYPSDGIESVLAEHFGDTMLSAALTEVVIPSYDLTAPGPFFFKRVYAKTEGAGWDVPMALAARATSAAPTYFDPAVLPAYDPSGDHALVDGGTFANNPTLAGYADALRLKGDAPKVMVVSIGTGLAPQTPGSGPTPIPGDKAADFGLARWARPILEVVLDGVPKAVEYQMKVMQAASAGSLSYYRLQSHLPTASHALDDVTPENCANLEQDARALIAEHADDLQRIYTELTAG